MDRKIYRIPTNFRQAGYIFNGMIAIRNAIDALLFGLLGLLIASLLPLTGTGRLSISILLAGLLAMIGLAGVREKPLSTFLADVVRWLFRRKPRLYNSHGGAYSVTAEELMLQQPQLRDSLADLLDKVKKSISSDQPELIEGVNFAFAPDPELEALRFAQEMKEEGQNKADTPKATVPEKSQSPVMSHIDIEDILDHIEFIDDEEGGI